MYRTLEIRITDSMCLPAVHRYRSVRWDTTSPIWHCRGWCGHSQTCLWAVHIGRHPVPLIFTSRLCVIMKDRRGIINEYCQVVILLQIRFEEESFRSIDVIGSWSWPEIESLNSVPLLELSNLIDVIRSSVDYTGI